MSPMQIPKDSSDPSSWRFQLNDESQKAVGPDWKRKLSPLVYLGAILLAPWSSWLPQALYVGAALVWLIPDRRIERVLHGRESGSVDGS